MSAKTITSGYFSSYSVASGEVVFEAAVVIGGSGLTLSSGATAVSYGTIFAASFEDGGFAVSGAGTIINLGSIGGYSGIGMSAGVVINHGTIMGSPTRYGGRYGISMTGGGIVNYGTIGEGGSDYPGLALRLGHGTITNFGVIAGNGHEAVDLGTGTLVNDGFIGGRHAVVFHSPSDVLVVGVSAGFDGGVNGDGGTIDLAAGATTGTLDGRDLGVNFGHFSSLEVMAGATWDLKDGGVQGALTLAGPGTVLFTGDDTNDGTLVTGSGQPVLTLGPQGSFANDGTIEGTGMALEGPGTLVNAGTIGEAGGTSVLFTSSLDVLGLVAGAAFAGEVVGGGGTLLLENGAPGTLSGLGTHFVQFAHDAVMARAEWTLAGADTLDGTAQLVVSGTLALPGTLVARGTIAGRGQVDLSGTLLNSGRIGGVSLGLDPGGALVEAAGSRIAGVVTADGTLSQAGGTGTLSGLSGAGQGLILAGGPWTLGGGTIAAGTTLTDGGSLTLSGSETNAGLLLADRTVRVAGPAATVTNAGTIDGGRGTALLLGSARDRLVVEQGARFIGTIAGGGGTLELAGATGSLSGLGTQFIDFGLALVDPSARWTLGGTSRLAAGETLTVEGEAVLAGTARLAGRIDGTGTLAEGAHSVTTVEPGAAVAVGDWSLAAGARLTIAAGGLAFAGVLDWAGDATLGGSATLSLGGSAILHGATVAGGGTLVTSGPVSDTAAAIEGTVTWRNEGEARISGTSVLSAGATLVNTARGAIDLAGTISGGTLVNDGVLDDSGVGMVTAAITNVGTIEVAAGRLLLDGPVAGAGGTISLRGNAVALVLGGAVGNGQVVAFAGPRGTLQLDDAGAFDGGLAGFAAHDRIDLAGFAHGSGEHLGFKENGSFTAGLLTVTDGSLVARITLFGQYNAAWFALASDGAGGSIVTYTPRADASAALAAPVSARSG